MTPLTPEQIARAAIDGQLTQARWTVQSRADMNVAGSLGVAVREFSTDSGPCDYLLFIAGKPAGVIEAKRQGVALTSVEAQTRDYAGSLPDWLSPPLRPLPFLYESTGAETRFTNLLDPTPRSRPVFNFHQPATLQAWSDTAVAIRRKKAGAPIAPTFLGRLRHAPHLTHAGLWEPQFRALQNLEASIRDGRPRALVQMATGAGKTLTAVAALYRLIKFGGARRVLFLVDRGNLGKQVGVVTPRRAALRSRPKRGILTFDAHAAVFPRGPSKRSNNIATARRGAADSIRCPSVGLLAKADLSKS